MDDGTGEPSDDRQALGLQHFAHVLAVELAQAAADLVEEREAQARRLFQQSQQLRPWQKPQFRVLHRCGPRRPRLVVQHRHLAEKLTGPGVSHRVPFVVPATHENLHLTRSHHVQAITPVAFVEDDFARRNGLPPRHAGHPGQFGRGQMTK
jgi:hypothetical protein